MYFYLENPTDRAAWWATVYGVAKESDTIYKLNNNKERDTEIREESWVRGSSKCQTAFLELKTHCIKHGSKKRKSRII